jgi:hypothetical protein
MATKSLSKPDFAALQQSLQAQFRGLNPNDRGRTVVCLAEQF